MYPFKILNKKKYLLFELNAIIVNLSIYLIPVVFSFFLNGAITGKKILFIIISIGILKLVNIITNHIWTVNANVFLEKYQNSLRIEYFKRILNLPVSNLNETHSGFLKKQVDIVTDESRSLLRCIFDNINGIAISVLIFLIKIYSQDKIIFIICIISIIFIIIFNYYISKKAKKYQEKYNLDNSKYNAIYSDLLQNAKAIKRFDADKYGINKIDNSYDYVNLSLYNKKKIDIIRFNLVGFFVLMLFIIVLINLYFKMKTGIEITSYLAFYITIYTGLERELQSISIIFEAVTNLRAANSQVENILSIVDDKPKVRKWSKVVIKDVDYKYEENSKHSIQIPYFELKQKDKISIIGKSGQGKTTFLNIFSKILDVDSDKYLIDNKKTKSRLDVAYISQDIDLLNTSIYENLTLGKNIKEAELNKLLKNTDLYDWVQKLPNKLNTLIGERGVKLSAGQRQRLNIIRGILLDKEVYILDEPTSNLDKETENAIINLINKNLKNKTVLIVTHRLELESICSKHYYFENNTMEEKK